MSDYENLPEEQWESVTEALINKHPLKDHIVDLSLKTWASILNGKINSYLNITIGDMELSPQAVSNLLHDILPVYVSRQFNDWKKGGSDEKDLEYIPNKKYSVEVKVSSSPKGIYGNRSYTQVGGSSKKSKSGYYLAINIDKLGIPDPQIRTIRFGWLDHSDWIGQKSSTGQQARLDTKALSKKLITIYPV